MSVRKVPAAKRTKRKVSSVPAPGSRPSSDVLKTKVSNLAVYLHDHLAGAVTALELLDHLIAGTKDRALKQQLTTLRQEISVDHEELKKLVTHLGLEENALKKAAAWIGEKMARLKLGLTHADKASVGFLQALEVLCLGITGKQALWDAMQAIRRPRSQSLFDFPLLAERASKQHRKVELLRLAAARAAFL